MNPEDAPDKQGVTFLLAPYRYEATRFAVRHAIVPWWFLANEFSLLGTRGAKFVRVGGYQGNELIEASIVATGAVEVPESEFAPKPPEPVEVPPPPMELDPIPFNETSLERVNDAPPKDPEP